MHGRTDLSCHAGIILAPMPVQHYSSTIACLSLLLVNCTCFARHLDMCAKFNSWIRCLLPSNMVASHVKLDRVHYCSHLFLYMLPEIRSLVLYIKLYMLSISILYYTQLTLQLLENFQLLPDTISARVVDALPVCVP